MRKELIHWLKNQPNYRVRDEKRKPFGIEIDGVRYSGATDGHAITLLESDFAPLTKDFGFLPISTWVTEAEKNPMTTVQMDDLRAWCAPIRKTGNAYCSDCDNLLVEFEAIERDPNVGRLVGFVLDRSILWDWLAPLPGPSADVHTPDRFDGTLLVAGCNWKVLMMGMNLDADTVAASPEFSEP